MNKSGQLGLWAILCRITNVPTSEPFMVSVYCGVGKPSSLQMYLEPFLKDVAVLASNGMVLKGAHVDVKLTAMICDAPARSYVKAITGHNGYNACPVKAAIRKANALMASRHSQTCSHPNVQMPPFGGRMMNATIPVCLPSCRLISTW